VFHSATGTGIATDVPHTEAGVPHTDADVGANGGTDEATAAEAAERGGLYFQRCRWCHTVMFQRLLCPICASTDLDLELSEGTGTVHRSTVIHRNTSAARTMSLIDMAEGFTVHCRVIGPPDAVRTGARVRLARDVDPARPDQELVFQLCDNPYGAWPSVPAVRRAG
jgi:uncharacterized OB-fold protein